VTNIAYPQRCQELLEKLRIKTEEDNEKKRKIEKFENERH